MELWNRVSVRFRDLQNESKPTSLFLSFSPSYPSIIIGINELLYDTVYFGDRAMETLKLARSLHLEFERRQRRLSLALAAVEFDYESALGPAEREEFASHWATGILSLPLRPLQTVPTHHGHPLPRSGRRESSHHNTSIDDRVNPEPSSLMAPGGDPGQGTSRQGERDPSLEIFRHDPGGEFVECEDGGKGGPTSPIDLTQLSDVEDGGNGGPAFTIDLTQLPD